MFLPDIVREINAHNENASFHFYMIFYCIILYSFLTNWWHGGGVVKTVVSQQEGPRFDSISVWSLHVLTRAAVNYVNKK